MESKKRTLQTMSPLKIGNVEMQNPLVLAPMAGRICRSAFSARSREQA